VYRYRAKGQQAMVHNYEVGTLYEPGRASWPESARYHYRIGAHELLLFRDASPEEGEAIRSGPCEFAALVEEGVLFFLFRFGEVVPWSVAPFSIWLVNMSERVLPGPLLEGEREELQVILVEAATGLIRALRTVLLPAPLSAALNRAIEEQAARPWPGQAGYEAAVSGVLARHATPADLLAWARLAMETEGARGSGRE
jgi:hypothetical protein